MERFNLFQVYGIEAEYMIVDKDSLKALPLTEYVLSELAGGPVENEVELEHVAWSNELVSHVIELKCNPPIDRLSDLDIIFHREIMRVNEILATKNAKLLPTAAHPWFDPHKESVLWPYGQKEIYQKYNEIFSCTGHGWSNLQSVHINLPFNTEEDFGNLMAGIRFIMPLIPYLAASSPFLDGKLGKKADNRLDVYEQNQKRVPSITADVIPEAIYSYSGYEQMLAGIYKDISIYDPNGILQHTWLNSRGAIAKFDVGAIEIRIMDIGECPLVDISIVSFICELIKKMVLDKKYLTTIKDIPSKTLIDTYHKAKGFEDFNIDSLYLKVFGQSDQQLSVGDFLTRLLDLVKDQMLERHVAVIEKIIKQGNLSKRIVAKNAEPTTSVYHTLAKCLADNTQF